MFFSSLQTKITTYLHKRRLMLVVALLLFALAPLVGYGQSSPTGGGGVIQSFAVTALFSVVNFILWGILKLVSFAVAGAGAFANWTLQATPLITSEVVQLGWSVTRDFANMFFILVLLGIALDFILFNSFGVKRALPRLILVALLINFSLPLAGLLIDFANVFAQFFLDKLGGGSFTQGVAQALNLTKLWDIGVSGAALDNVAAANTSVMMDMIFAIFFTIGTAIILLALGVMFLLRIGYLVVLLVLLPLVLVLWAFPPTSGYFGRWSNKFISWTMFAPVALFFLWLAMFFFNAMAETDAVAALQGLQGSGAPFINTLLTYIVVWIFMLGALVVGQSVGIKLAGATMAGFSKTGKWARGRASQYGRKGLEKAGFDKGLDKGAQLAGKIPIVGGFAARGLTTGAERIRAAKKELAELTKADKGILESGSEEVVTQQIQTYSKSLIADERAKAAKMAGVAAQKGKLKVKLPDGTFDAEATRDLKRLLRKEAKAINDSDTVKAIDRSDFVVAKEAIDETHHYNAEGSFTGDPKNSNATEVSIDKDSGKSFKEAHDRKLKDLYQKINLYKEDWDDSVVRDDPNFVPNMIKYNALNGEKLKQAQKSGNTAIIQQLRVYMTDQKQKGHRMEHLMNQENAAFRKWLVSNASAPVIGIDTDSIVAEIGERKGAAQAIKELRRGASKEDRESIRKMHKQDKA